MTAAAKSKSASKPAAAATKRAAVSTKPPKVTAPDAEDDGGAGRPKVPEGQNMAMWPNATTIAKVAYGVNRAYCAGIGDVMPPAWGDLSDARRASCVAGVEALLDNPELSFEEQHNEWCRVRIADGWAFGPVKDEAMRTHPNLMHYSNLPSEQRAKDHIFRGVIEMMSEGMI